MPKVPDDPLAEIGSAPPTGGWTGTEVSVRLRRGAGGTVRVDGVLCRAPVWFHWDGATLWLVGSGASPVGEDRIRIRVDVGAGVAVAIRSVAATLVYAARGTGTRWDTEIHVAEGASVDWNPEPVILTERARHEATTTVHAAGGADVRLDEVLVLGRAGEATGALRSTLAVRIDDAPALLTSIDTSLPAWSGPAGVGNCSVIAHRLRVGPEKDPAVTADASRRAALLQPAPGCRLAVVAADDVSTARRSLDAVLTADLLSVIRPKHRGR
ncbi:MAG: urease accessory protein UreD [Acidimicrobiales bacterium]|nr:urease accessory protein UreD [Acidimicrobiales bacterium]